MNIWKCDYWKTIINVNSSFNRSGLRLHFQKGVDEEVKRSCSEFAVWIRKQYYFPIRLPIYFKASEYVKIKTGEFVSAKFFEPFDRTVEPYISIATGDVIEIEKNYGQDNALAAVLSSMAHEITHYFQWINDIRLSDKQAERQAKYYQKKIIREYALTREHP